ncbi:hypothetical protein LVJ85_00085 [Neisseria sp. Dent CA1/247]|uniref:hypothetical protein n=1 Tax=Neisseria sp. Dent CA1/247 TaxID=2912675 RepID=UPI001FD3F2B2|nr:hypothetical protein [Neisseria sp. Dent CA1/247]UOO76953.1 hypothetical protein LVJ85_00085 [Neisseria sp. Dent CA1/247]
MNKEQRKRAESYIFYSLPFITVIIFVVSPAYMDINSKLDNALNHFIDNYLLGNGYYSPPNYPFAAKITNSFSVVIAIVAGVFAGIWRRNDIERIYKYTWLVCLGILALGVATFFTSLNPQEFRESTLRLSFGTSQSFHNNPITFLAMMIGKQLWIYISVRAPLTYLLYKIDKIRK